MEPPVVNAPAALCQVSTAATARRSGAASVGSLVGQMRIVAENVHELRAPGILRAGSGDDGDEG
jgi:hypothetical protein